MYAFGASLPIALTVLEFRPHGVTSEVRGVACQATSSFRCLSPRYSSRRGFRLWAQTPAEWRKFNFWRPD